MQRWAGATREQVTITCSQQPLNETTKSTNTRNLFSLHDIPQQCLVSSDVIIANRIETNQTCQQHPLAFWGFSKPTFFRAWLRRSLVSTEGLKCPRCNKPQLLHRKSSKSWSSSTWALNERCRLKGITTSHSVCLKTGCQTGAFLLLTPELPNLKYHTVCISNFDHRRDGLANWENLSLGLSLIPYFFRDNLQCATCRHSWGRG